MYASELKEKKIMAEKKEKKIISADTQQEISKEEIEAKRKEGYKEAKPVGNAKSKRILAIILWVVAIAMEVLAVLVINGKGVHFMSQLTQLIIALIIDLACVIIGSQFWKQANRIDPASEANKVKFWLWNNMGVIVCTIAFIPVIILMLTNKELDKKTKAIATVVAIIALLIGGVCSYDFNPVSEEQLNAATEALGSEQVYWSPFGHVYHTHDDCQSLNQSEQLTVGTVDQAIAANRTRLCAFCAKQDGITGVVTDDSAKAAIEDSDEDSADEAEDELDVVEDEDLGE